MSSSGKERLHLGIKGGAWSKEHANTTRRHKTRQQQQTKSMELQSYKQEEQKSSQTGQTETSENTLQTQEQI